MNILLIAFLSLSALAQTDLQYFPKNYESSKIRFLQDAEKIKSSYQRVEIGSFSVGDPNLTIDHVYIPAQSEQKYLIVLTSGTHGPEGYAGSAIQTLFMREVLPGLDLSRVGVILVHALNPWGFKHHRRDTENNVNLNRNFDLSSELFNIQNEGYDKLRKYLEIRREIRTSLSFPAGNLLLQMMLKKNITQQSLTEAIGKGQYSSPTGLNFGGNAFEPQTLYMIDYFKRITPHYKEIFHIDLHTGLGKKGILHIMTKKEMNQISRKKLEETFFDAESDIYEITPPEAEGFYEIQGDYANIISKLLPEEDRIVVGITAEFGTVGNGLKGKVKTINRLVMENRGHFSGYANECAERKVKKKFLELFHPSNKNWRKKVLIKGRFLVDQVVKRFSEQ